MTATYDIVTGQRDTFSKVLRWEAGPLVSKPITAIVRGTPAQITAPLHGLPPNWRVAVVGAGGMQQINAQSYPPRVRDFNRCTVIDPNTITIPNISSAGYAAYTSGGALVYNTPVSLVGFTARMSIKDVVGGTELLRLDTTNGRIALDTVNYTISLTIDPVTMLLQAWAAGVYDLELVSAAGVVTTLIPTSRFTITPATTTT